LGRISRFGLLEMSRQRLRPSLGESSQEVCPRCSGHGRIRSVELLSLSILRLSEEHAMKENTGQVLVQAPPQIANYLLNEKRRAISEIEARHNAPIVIVADDKLETPHFEVTRIRENELGEETSRPSYHRTTPRKLETHALTRANLNIPDLPAVTNVRPAAPAPLREETEEAPAPAAAVPARKPGLLARIAAFFGGGSPSAVAAPTVAPAPTGRDGRNGRKDKDARRTRDEDRQKGRKRQRGERDEGRREESRGQDARREDGRARDDARGGERRDGRKQERRQKQEARAERQGGQREARAEQQRGQSKPVAPAPA